MYSPMPRRRSIGYNRFISLKAIGVSVAPILIDSLFLFRERVVLAVRCPPPTQVSRRPPVFLLVLPFPPHLLLILLTILCLLRLQLGLPSSPPPLIRRHPVSEVFTLALRLIIQAARIRPQYHPHQVMCLLRYLILQRVSIRQHQRERYILLCISSEIWAPHLPSNFILHLPIQHKVVGVF